MSGRGTVAGGVPSEMARDLFTVVKPQDTYPTRSDRNVALASHPPRTVQHIAVLFNLHLGQVDAFVMVVRPKTCRVQRHGVWWCGMSNIRREETLATGLGIDIAKH